MFPFNASTPEIAQAALTAWAAIVASISWPWPTACGRMGRAPGPSIDTAQYGVDLVKKWIDLANRRGVVLFLYGHRILPDEAFTQVASWQSPAS